MYVQRLVWKSFANDRTMVRLMISRRRRFLRDATVEKVAAAKEQRGVTEHEK